MLSPNGDRRASRIQFVEFEKKGFWSLSPNNEWSDTLIPLKPLNSHTQKIADFLLLPSPSKHKPILIFQFQQTLSIPQISFQFMSVNLLDFFTASPSSFLKSRRKLLLNPLIPSFCRLQTFDFDLTIGWDLKVEQNQSQIKMTKIFLLSLFSLLSR